MASGSPQRFDVLVVGGGPAGMAAAVRAAECGVTSESSMTISDLADKSGVVLSKDWLQRLGMGGTDCGLGVSLCSAECAYFTSHEPGVLAGGGS